MYSLSVIKIATFLWKGAYESDVKHFLVLGSYLHKITLAEVHMFVILSVMEDRNKRHCQFFFEVAYQGELLSDDWSPDIWIRYLW